MGLAALWRGVAAARGAGGLARRWGSLDLYLEPEAAYAAVQKQGRDSGEPPAVTGRTLRKRRLHERGLLVSVDDARHVLTVRRTLGGRRWEVLHTSEALLSLQIDNLTNPTTQVRSSKNTGILRLPSGRVSIP